MECEKCKIADLIIKLRAENNDLRKQLTDMENFAKERVADYEFVYEQQKRFEIVNQEQEEIIQKLNDRIQELIIPQSYENIIENKPENHQKIPGLVILSKLNE